MIQRWLAWLRRRPVVGAAVLVFGVAAVLVLVVWVLPSLLAWKPELGGAEEHKAISDVRTGMIALLAALGAAGGLAYTARTFHLSQVAHLTGRFQDASKQMGDDDPTVRLGGIHAMAYLADDWTDQRQRCVDVLCAYVRNTRPGEDAEHHRDSRRRGLQVIADRLRGPKTWMGCDFDFTNATIEAADFSEVSFSTGRFLFAGAHFEGRVSFDAAEFAGAFVDLSGAEFGSSCRVSLRGAKFRSGTVTLDDTKFTGGEVSFENAGFGVGCLVTFAGARLGYGGDVRFDAATFNDATSRGGAERRGVTFAHAQFESAENARSVVSFAGATMKDRVSFEGARFARPVDFSRCVLGGATLSFRGATFAKDLVFDDAECDGSTFEIDDRDHLNLQGGSIDLRKARGTPIVSGGELGRAPFLLSREPPQP